MSNTRKKTLAVHAMTEFIKTQTLTPGKRFGLCEDRKNVYLMDGVDTCYKINKNLFMVDLKKVKSIRVIKIGFYKNLFDESKEFKRINQRLSVHGEKMTVLENEDAKLYIPYKAMSIFGTKDLRYFGKDEVSPVFICDHRDSNWEHVLGFVMPVPVSDAKRKVVVLSDEQ